MKRFIFDCLVDRENICNLKKEQKKLKEMIDKKSNIVLYAPRNFGKTSILKNIIIPDYKKGNKRSFVFFADLFQVKSIESIISRLSIAFERSFEKSFPVKSIIQNIKTLFGSLSPEVNIDPFTNSVNLSIAPILKKRSYSVESIFELINKIASKIPALVIIDEFQDISFIPEAEAIFRTAFQNISSLPIILSGSKAHILTQIFANPNSPLSSWGKDIEFKPIEYKEYYNYIQQRFKKYNINIDYNLSIKLQELMYRIPESINIICQNLIDLFPDKTIKESMIYKALYFILENRESRYEIYLGLLSSSEEKVLICLAKVGNIQKKVSNDFVRMTGYTARTVSKIFTKLLNNGIIEKYNNKYRITDPLLKYYLLRYRK